MPEMRNINFLMLPSNGNLLRFPRMELYQRNRYDTREIELTLRYRFNAAKSKYKGTGAGVGEINRL